LKQKHFDSRDNQLLLPAKQISSNKDDVKEIIRFRLENGFYNQEIVQSNIIKKLMKDLFKVPPFN
jgi:hypothetical protein